MPKPDLLQDDSGHFVQGCVSLLSFRHPKLLHHDSVSKGITWGCRTVQQSATQTKRVHPLTGIPWSTWDIHTAMWSKAEVWSLLWQNYSTHWTDIWEQGLVVCVSGHAESASSSSQHPQVHSGHKFSITDTFCNFSISFFEAAISLLDSAVAFPFSLARFLSLAFQGGSLCLFLSPYVLNNCRAKKRGHYFESGMQIWVTYTNS